MKFHREFKGYFSRVRIWLVLKSIKYMYRVVVGPGFLNNGSSFVHFLSRGCRPISLRMDMRPINLVMRPQMSLDDGNGYLPVLNIGGFWTLVTRGDSSFLVRRVAE